MSVLQGTLFLRIFAAFALFAFAGDIVADSLVDAREGHCVAHACPSDSHSEKTPCSHCSCAVHNGTVIVANNNVPVNDDFGAFTFVRAGDASAPISMPAAIDHPPQLA
jgi:hypothetical protein